MPSQSPLTRCCIIPENLLQKICDNENESPHVRRAVRQTIQAEQDQIAAPEPYTVLQPGTLVPAGLSRLIFHANNQNVLPGISSRSKEFERLRSCEQKNCRKEHDHVRQTATLSHRIKLVYEFFENKYRFRLLNGHGGLITATTNFRKDYANAFWDFNTNHLVFGEGVVDWGNNLVQSLDVVAHELTHGIIAATSKLRYMNESGALNEHLADVFGTLCSQARMDTDTTWLIGAGCFGKDPQGQKSFTNTTPGQEWELIGGSRPGFLRSFEDPTAGWFSQPNHYSEKMTGEQDAGGVHVNSGIPNFAFYNAAIAAGGKPWLGLGRVWFATMIDRRLGVDCDFARFAAATLSHARSQDTQLVKPIQDGWEIVGIEPATQFP